MRGRPACRVLAVLLLLGGCGAPARPAPAVTARPVRVMSLNQCTDQLVLALLPPGRIASVTWLSRDPAGSLMAAAARRVPVNHGQAEEVLAERPDLVVAGAFTTPALRGMLHRLGYPMIEVPEATSIAGIRAVTRQVARAVGEPARGEALIARMDRTLAELARDPAPPLRVAAWDGSGFAAGTGTLYDAVLQAAGARNVGREAASAGGGRPDVERLLQTAPALLVRGARDRSDRGLRDDVARHRLVRRWWGAARTVTIRQAAYACGTPMVADAAVSLRTQLRAAAAAARPLPFAPATMR